jgi:hypothetical protein
MVDQHQNLPKTRQRFGFMVDPFLSEYQKHTGYRINDDDEAMETIHKHHRFLLKQMIEERESIDWSSTYLWKHLVETYAEEINELRVTLAQQLEQMELQAGEATDDSAESSSSDEEDAEDEGEDGEDGSDSTPGTDAKSAESSDSSDSEPEQTKDWTSTIWELLNILRKSPQVNMRQCGIEQVAVELRKLPAFQPNDQRTAVKAIERSAAELIRLMNEAKLRKKFNWSTRAIYNELEATYAGEVAEETIKTPAAKGTRQRHRMKSVLRPSGAGMARKSTRGLPDHDEDEEMLDQPALSPVASRKNLQHLARTTREATADSATSRGDSPSRQLNGNYDPNALPELPPPPEAQEMMDLVAQEAKRVGRQHQTSHLKDFLEHFSWDG